MHWLALTSPKMLPLPLTGKDMPCYGLAIINAPSNCQPTHGHLPPKNANKSRDSSLNPGLIPRFDVPDETHCLLAHRVGWIFNVSLG